MVLKISFSLFTQLKCTLNSEYLYFCFISQWLQHIFHVRKLKQWFFMYKMMQTYCRGKKETDFGNQSKHISNNPLNCYSDQKHKTVTFIRFIFFHYFSDYNVSAKPLSFVAQNFTIFVIVRNTSLSDNVAKLMDHEKLCVGFVYFL